jgi:indolepyruvate ferredoxin oxidoreductase beta subunit
MNYDIYLVGVGGQGVLTIAELITEAAYLQGLPVNYYPTEGMAQRGGFVKAQVRLGRGFVGPNIPEKGADLAISMELSESLKAVRFIKPGGRFCALGAYLAADGCHAGQGALSNAGHGARADRAGRRAPPLP